ncbi:sterol desaturase [Cordyceps fumosorosea ARSEF 2679]|uniref:Sterol desaturase n=1 Tax=Cordyceps fumosorosea (strain ARSEF 2679) TaxID=1081104 RepID=A0A168B4I6_CORFA|nr:sterol desaturase [Cordyceps fumosorosea ARSEF 2679]OAA69606.1 sterol desaturase [Cordyceps fumosorosea ARSEF 2679]
MSSTAIHTDTVSARTSSPSKATAALLTPASRHFVPTDLDGTVIPHARRWLYSTPAFACGAFGSRAANVVVVGLFVLWQRSAAAHRLYAHLDAVYGAAAVNLWGTFLLTSVFFWAWGGLFALADLTGRPRWLFRYKTQPFVRVSPHDYARICLVSLRNQVLVALPLLLVVSRLAPPRPVHPSALPSAARTVATVIFDVLCTEVGFYYVHRAFHSRALYARFHKKHHEFAAPVGLAATYCTAAEHVLSNLLPNALGTLLVPHHWSQQCFAFLLLEFGTVVAHSGYNLPGLPSNLQHDFHHFAFDENFGPAGLLDAWHGTNRKYKEALGEARARVDGNEERARGLVLKRLAEIEVAAAEEEAKKNN